MHKAITIILFKLEGQKLIHRPEFGMSDRLLLDKVDYENRCITIGGVTYPMEDTDFPTVDPKNPYALSAEENSVIEQLTAAFQPHLYTRTRDFAEEFAEALSNVDKLILLDIYPAREEPIPGVTSEIIFKDVTAPEKVLLKRSEFMEYMQNEEVELLVTLGAGDIDRFVGPIAQMLEDRR
jgi:hypothetical protein